MVSLFSIGRHLWFAVAALGWLGCGNLEADRICLGRTCQMLGESFACTAFVSCYERTGGTVGSLDSTYGPKGTCWRATSPSVAESCTAACASALSSLRSQFPDAGC